MFCEVLTNTKGENWLNYHALHDGSMLVNTQQKTTSCFSSLKCQKKKKTFASCNMFKSCFFYEHYQKKTGSCWSQYSFNILLYFCYGFEIYHHPTQIIFHFSFYMSFQDHKGRHTIINKDKGKQKHVSNLIKY